MRLSFCDDSRKLLEDEPGLVRDAQRGDRPAAAALVERYWDRLYRWLYHLTHDRHTAEDLAQEAFLKAFAALRRFQPDTNFRAWLFRIAHNAFANHCRASTRHAGAARLPDDLAAPQRALTWRTVRPAAPSSIGSRRSSSKSRSSLCRRRLAARPWSLASCKRRPLAENRPSARPWSAARCAPREGAPKCARAGGGSW